MNMPEIVPESKMEAKGIPGTLRVYGAAAEESEGAKVFMAREGLFDDLNAVLHWHPMEFARVAIRGGSSKPGFHAQALP